jgi:hypothetical protein
VFCLLKTDLIRAFYAGALPSFAECKQLTEFLCEENQFAGGYSRVSTDRRVEVSNPYYIPVVFHSSVSSHSAHCCDALTELRVLPINICTDVHFPLCSAQCSNLRCVQFWTVQLD